MNNDFGTHPLALRAQEILTEGAFHTARVTLPQAQAGVLVAENPYTVAAVAGVDQWHDVAPYVNVLATEFANWALSRQPQAKQWDLYLIVLIVQPVTSDSELTEIEQFTDDTRYVRRLIRHGVVSDRDSADALTALAALLPLQLPDRIAERDPYSALVEALRGQGVDRDLAAQTVEQFVARKGSNQ
jgi:hypothetical protein